MPVTISEAPGATRVVVKKTKRNKVISPDIPRPLSNKCFSAIVAGAPNSGKSVLIDSLMSKQYRHCFTNVVLVCPETSSCLLYTSPSPRDKRQSRMPSSA